LNYIVVASPRRIKMTAAQADLATARRGLERPDKFPPEVVVQLACLALEGFLEAELDRCQAWVGGHTLGHRVRAWARIRPLDPALVTDVTLLGAQGAVCDALGAGPRRFTPDEAARAVSLAETVADLMQATAAPPPSIAGSLKGETL